MTTGCQTFNQGGHSSSTTPPQIESGRRGCYVFDEFSHVANDYPQFIFRPTPISVVRGGL